MWRIDDPQGSETNKVKFQVVPYTRGKGVDIGCGPWKGFAHWIGVDNMHHANEFGWQYKPDIVSDADDLSIFGDGSLDFVYSSHTLEHLVDARKALAEWWRVVKVGGYMILYLPHKDFYPNCGEKGSNPDHKHDFHPQDIVQMMKNMSGWDLVVNENRDYDYGPGDHRNEYSFLQIYKKTKGGHFYSCRKEKPEKTACVVRYGGFGDMIQAASVLPELKKKGFHVSFMTTPKGHDILKHDPHIDEFIIQDNDQVPNQDLGPYWESWERYFDRFINFSEVVEGSLLAVPGRTAHKYPKKLRHQLMDVNYLERHHDVAQVPHEFHAKFYPSEDEIRWAIDERNKIDAPIIMWSLSGSSMHKMTPYVDNVVARLMLETDVHVVLAGDNVCQILEGGSWVNEPRVHCRSGIWSIRESLTFAIYGADIVVGPETGVLNAVGMEQTRKVIALSHSSAENLTKHWDNYIALTSRANCYPCHQMHYGKGTCPYIKLEDVEYDGQEQSVVTPACTYDITPDIWFEAISVHLKDIEGETCQPQVAQTLR